MPWEKFMIIFHSLNAYSKHAALALATCEDLRQSNPGFHKCACCYLISLLQLPYVLVPSGRLVIVFCLLGDMFSHEPCVAISLWDCSVEALDIAVWKIDLFADRL